MGRNLLLNMADQKFAVAGLDLDEEKVFHSHTKRIHNTELRPP
jgi:6-phosphogluconate dehydrogenase